MDEVISSLDRAIKSSSSLVDQIQPQISGEELAEFSRLCQKFVEIQTKYRIAKKLENKNFENDITEDDIRKVQSDNEDMKNKIREIQQNNDQINPDELKALIKQSIITLQELQEKNKIGGDREIDKITKAAHEELEHLEEAAKSNDWYKAAYQKLSQFTGIEIHDENSVRILGTHDITFQENRIQLSPNNVFVEDINPANEPRNICISEIIERIAALRDMKELSKRLNWELECSNEAPIVYLHPPAGVTNTQAPAMFALVGMTEHPLVRWGNVNVDEFNTTQKNMYEKIKLYESKA